MADINTPKVQCPSCGRYNESDYSYCSGCGTARSAAGQNYGQSLLTQPFPVSASDYHFKKMITQTKNGLLLMIIGFLLQWIPVIQDIAALISLTGVIFVVLGRNAFGRKHASYVVAAVIIYIVGFFSTIILAFSFASAISAAAYSSSSSSAASIISAFNDLLWGSLIIAVVIGISVVMLPYQLESAGGRIFLWVTFAVQIALGVIIIAVIGPEISSAVRLTFSTSPPELLSMLNLENSLNNLRLLSVISSVMLAIAYYIPWKRIDTGMIPADVAWQNR
ncbi:MAG: zinc ribbon domain-containing protein [Candidatus Thermoplasmatota archaeon]|nr:zinc ribbon domain-containing protein [Candidatus Thermoplasmatota archaeon]